MFDAKPPPRYTYLIRDNAYLDSRFKSFRPNTASYVQMGDQIGTLETGKLADVILLDGDPLEGYWNWLRTKVVVKGGVVVVDKR